MKEVPMGVLSNIFKPRDKPENKTAGSAYTFYMGGTTSGKAVTERSAMQMTAAKKKPSTILYTDCSMMSRIRK